MLAKARGDMFHVDKLFGDPDSPKCGLLDKILRLHLVSEPPEGTDSWDVQALFPDEDIEEVRLACQDYPVLQDTLNPKP